MIQFVFGFLITIFFIVCNANKNKNQLQLKEVLTGHDLFVNKQKVNKHEETQRVSQVYENIRITLSFISDQLHSVLED